MVIVDDHLTLLVLAGVVSGRAKLAKRDGRVSVVLDVPKQECPSCRERCLDWDVARRLDVILNAMRAGDVEVATGTTTTLD